MAISVSVKKFSGREYVYICESFRDPITRRPTSRVLHSFGRKDKLLEEKPINFRETGLVQPCQFIPDSLTLSEVLDVFQRTHGDFAVILNEYALVVGIITINDVMSTVMADLVTTSDELQIIPREDGTWLVDGSTPIDDLEHALGIDELPEDSAYETVAGFMMYMLRKIPKRTDKVTTNGFAFEVLDVDNNRIDQVLVTRIKTVQDAPAED